MKMLRNKRGMTLPEVMVASTYAMLMTASLYAFASFFNNARIEYTANVEVTNIARKAIERMVWGTRDAGQAQRYGIAEAVTGTINSSSQFSYTDVAGGSHSVRLNSGNIEYQRGGGGWTTLLDPNGSTVAYDATKATTSLQFAGGTNQNSVDVKIVVGKKILNKWYYGSAGTIVYYRNNAA